MTKLNVTEFKLRNIEISTNVFNKTYYSNIKTKKLVDYETDISLTFDFIVKEISKTKAKSEYKQASFVLLRRVFEKYYEENH